MNFQILTHSCNRQSDQKNKTWLKPQSPLRFPLSSHCRSKSHHYLISSTCILKYKYDSEKMTTEFPINTCYSLTCYYPVECSATMEACAEHMFLCLTAVYLYTWNICAMIVHLYNFHKQTWILLKDQCRSCRPMKEVHICTGWPEKLYSRIHM